MHGAPKHIAMIMDGNGRWAVSQGKSRLAGHRAGSNTVMRVVEWCIASGIQYLTLYAFSTENWKRSADEVNGLMQLMGMLLRTKTGLFLDRNVRVRVVGRRDDLPQSLRKDIDDAESKTSVCDGLQLILAVSYGGRAEIGMAAYRYACDLRDGKVSDGGQPPSEETFRKYLYAPDVPDPDLVIRTSGEFRLSNFLLWQCAYSEFWMTHVLWPDFSKEDFDAALEAFAARDRRMGGVKP